MFFARADIDWLAFSSKSNFFKLYETIIEIRATAIGFKIRGLIKSKLRSLALSLESNSSVKTSRINAKSYELDDNFYMFIGIVKSNECGLELEMTQFAEKFKKLEVILNHFI